MEMINHNYWPLAIEMISEHKTETQPWIYDFKQPILEFVSQNLRNQYTGIHKYDLWSVKGVQK